MTMTTELPAMHPHALTQIGMLLLLARNAKGGHWPLTATAAELAGGMGAATAERVAQILDDFDWRRAIERDNGVKLAWDGVTLVVTERTEGVGA